MSTVGIEKRESIKEEMKQSKILEIKAQENFQKG